MRRLPSAQVPTRPLTSRLLAQASHLALTRSTSAEVKVLAGRVHEACALRSCRTLPLHVPALWRRIERLEPGWVAAALAASLGASIRAIEGAF